MTMPAPKYEIGDKVFSAGRAYSTKRISCPDCLGTKLWTVVFADGTSEEIMCQTCKNGFEPASGVIAYNEWSPTVQPLTIGKIYGWEPDDGMKYMCNETGIGSGTIHYERNLFTNREEAQAQAEEEHREWMKRLARNNFSKKFKGKDKIENMLSTFGFSRRMKLEKAREFAQWAKLSGVIKGVA